MNGLKSASFFEFFKERFQQERDNLVYSHGLLNEHFHLSKDDMLDDVDLSTTELEQSMRLRLRSREALYLKKIDDALERIRSGEFGGCEACGEDIDLKRLEARPTTTMCVSCKEDQEKRELGSIDGRKPKSIGHKIRIA